MEFTFEPLGERVRVCVSAAHKFGTDAFLLSDFASPRRKDTACDLCAGCGIVPALWFRREETAPARAYAVELQEQAAQQLEITAREGGYGGRLIPLHADLRVLRGKLEAGAFDLVTCNPPYKAAGAGIPSENRAELIARHETECTLSDVCAAAAYLLRYGGRFCVCHRPERLADLLCEMRAHGLEPKRLRFVHQRPDSAPWLVLAEGRRGGKPFLQVEPPLLVEGEGGFSPEVLRIYLKERNL